jgi:hypothetical protein
MATGVIRHQSDGRFDNLFLSEMAEVTLASVFAGFARTYYLAGLFKAPLPNLRGTWPFFRPLPRGCRFMRVFCT